MPQCTLAAFHTPRTSPFEASLSGESCPDRTQIGTVDGPLLLRRRHVRTFGVFNLDPPPGAPSELGFNPYGAPITFIPHVRQADGEYGLTLGRREHPPAARPLRLHADDLGRPPGSILHNAQRGNCLNEAEPAFGWAKCSIGPPSVNPATAYLTLPTACEAPARSSALTPTPGSSPSNRVSRSFRRPEPRRLQHARLRAAADRHR